MQRPGIEPGPPAWQARILPLNQRCLIFGQIFLIILSEQYEDTMYDTCKRDSICSYYINALVRFIFKYLKF